MLKDHLESQIGRLSLSQVSVKHCVDECFSLIWSLDVPDGTSEHTRWTWSSLSIVNLTFDGGISQRSVSESALALRGSSTLDRSFMIDDALLSTKQSLIKATGKSDEVIRSAIRDLYETEMSALVRLKSSKLRDIYQLDVVNE